jgi:hypothetical protein
MLKIGEVIQADTVEFVAQCYELHQAPPLGSLVKTTVPRETYGVVCNAATTSIEPGRRPIALGREEESEAEVYRANPQLAKLFRTDFTALVVGYREGESWYQRLPPQPPPIHSFVYLCDAAEVREFTRSLDFLTLLLSARLTLSPEELMAACLRYASQAHPRPEEFLVRAGRELAQLWSGELQRLSTVLRRLKP